MLIPQKVVKIEWEKNFGELLTAVDPALANSTIHQVRISSNESFWHSLCRDDSARCYSSFPTCLTKANYPAYRAYYNVQTNFLDNHISQATAGGDS